MELNKIYNEILMKENISRIKTLKKLLKQAKTPHKRDRIKFLLSQVYKMMEKNMTEKEKRKLLEDYTNWLLKHNYTDSDVYTEEPVAVDRYLEEKKLQSSG